MEDAVRTVSNGASAAPDTLRTAAEALLAEAANAAPSRDTALALLAADALMTYACEVAAERTPEKLGEMR